jgi:HlyD family secretion protein
MKPNPRVMLPALLVVIVIVVAVVLARRAGHDDTTAGTIEATEAQLGFMVPGRVASVSVQEGDSARAGEVLAALDTVEAAARARQAAAQVDAARALLDEFERGARPEEIQQARAARSAAGQHLADAQQDFDRTQALITGHVVSQQTFDKAQVALDVARSQFQQADDGFKLVAQGPRHERLTAQRAQVAMAEAALAASRAQLANMIVRAPFGGVVTVRHHEPGEIVAAGAAAVSLLNRDDRWVRVYVSEARLGAVRIGLPATITCDTYPGRRYDGVVVAISSEAEFTPKNVQTQEERVKLVYAVKVRITGDSRFDLKPGMPADVRLARTAP